MKQSPKWLALVLISSQLLVTVPVTADVAALVTDIQATEQPAKIPETEKTQVVENSGQETTDADTSASDQQSSQSEVQNETEVSQPDTNVTEETETNPAPIEETEATEETTDNSRLEAKPEVERETEISTAQDETTESTNEKVTKPAQSAITNNGATVLPSTDTKAKSNEQSYASSTANSTEDTIIEGTTQETWNFIKEIGESARKIGLDKDLYASVMIVQAILESGSGTSRLSQDPYYNLFGIKGTYQGQGVSFTTREDNGDGTLSTISSNFRQYDNFEESLSDYVKLLQEGIVGNKDFYQGVWKSNTTSYEEATAYLTGRYATDTNYDQKLNVLIEDYDLTSYESEENSTSRR